MTKAELATSIQRYNRVSTASHRLGNNLFTFLAMSVAFCLCLRHPISAVAAYVLVRSAALMKDRAALRQLNQACELQNNPDLFCQELEKLPLEVATKIFKRSVVVRQGLSLHPELKTQLAVQNYKQAANHFFFH